jgi:hypothetical protein
MERKHGRIFSREDCIDSRLRSPLLALNVANTAAAA